MKVIFNAFLKLQFGFVFFLAEGYLQKAAFKMAMKLTTGI